MDKQDPTDSPQTPNPGATARENPPPNRRSGRTPKPRPETPEVRAVQLGELRPGPSLPSGESLPASLLDSVPLDVSIELGRTRLSFRAVKNLSQGAIVELDRPIGDPLDIRVNGRLVARGEVVVVRNERYGIRLTEVVRQDDQAEAGA